MNLAVIWQVLSVDEKVEARQRQQIESQDYGLAILQRTADCRTETVRDGFKEGFGACL